jgi:hypothetical protein
VWYGDRDEKLTRQGWQSVRTSWPAWSRARKLLTPSLNNMSDRTARPQQTQLYERNAMTRNGKIARLPLAIRLELNLRLQDGQKGRHLVAWLNGLPEVKAVMAAEFHGEPITESNLSRWKNGGYKTWEKEQSTREGAVALIESYPALQEAAKNGLSDQVALFLNTRMVLEMQRLDLEKDGARKFERWRELLEQFAVMRRDEFRGERLRLQEEKIGLQREMNQFERRKESASSSDAPPAGSLPR